MEIPKDTILKLIREPARGHQCCRSHGRRPPRQGSPTCVLDEDLVAAATVVERSPYGFCLVAKSQRIVLGRLRRSALAKAAAGATVETVMEPGASTVRPHTPASELVDRLAARELKTAVVTTPAGRLLGVFVRSAAERHLQA